MTARANGAAHAGHPAQHQPPMGELVWELEDTLRPWTGVLPSLPTDPVHVWRLRLRTVEEVVQAANRVSSEQQAEIDRLLDQVGELETKAGELESDLEAARSEQEAAEDEADQLQQRVEELEAEVKQLRAHIGELELEAAATAAPSPAAGSGSGVELEHDRATGEVSVR